MAQLLTFNLQDPQNALDTYGAGAVIRVERDTVSTFATASEITTIAIVAGTTEYEYRDQTGVAGTHYGRYRLSKASPSVAADYSGYLATYRYGDPGGQVITLETAKTWMGISDTDDDPWLPMTVGAINRAIVSGIGVDLGPSPDTTRTYDGCAAVNGGRRLWIPGGIRAFTTVEVSTDATTWTAITTQVRIGPLAQSRPSGEPGDHIEVIPGQYLDLSGYYYIRITGTAFATFGWDAWPDDLVQAALVAVQRMSRERDSQGQYVNETNARRYLDKDLLRAYAWRYFPPIR